MKKTSIHYAIACALLSLFLTGCVTTSEPRSTSDRTPSDGAVAVWDLEDLSPLGNARADLSEFLTARVQETVQGEGLVVVEREKLISVLEELTLGSSELAEDSTRLNIGRIAGARRMIFGGYQVIGGSMRIDLRMVETETGRVLRAVEKTVESAGMTGWLSAAEEAARDLAAP